MRLHALVAVLALLALQVTCDQFETWRATVRPRIKRVEEGLRMAINIMEQSDPTKVPRFEGIARNFNKYMSILSSKFDDPAEDKTRLMELSEQLFENMEALIKPVHLNHARENRERADEREKAASGQVVKAAEKETERKPGDVPEKPNNVPSESKAEEREASDQPAGAEKDVTDDVERLSDEVELPSDAGVSTFEAMVTDVIRGLKRVNAVLRATLDKIKDDDPAKQSLAADYEHMQKALDVFDKIQAWVREALASGVDAKKRREIMDYFQKIVSDMKKRIAAYSI